MGSIGAKPLVRSQGTGGGSGLPPEAEVIFALQEYICEVISTLIIRLRNCRIREYTKKKKTEAINFS